MADDFWPRLTRECVEEAMRIASDAEDFVHDQMIPSLLEREPPEQRQEFYDVLDWNKLRDTSPKLWTRLSADALDLEERQRDQQAKALASLEAMIAKQNNAFRPQVQTPPVFGLKLPGQPQMTTTAQGLDALPMGPAV